MMNSVNVDEMINARAPGVYNGIDRDGDNGIEVNTY